MALMSILKSLGRIPRRIDDAMWEKRSSIEKLDEIPEDMQDVYLDPASGDIVRARQEIDRTRPSKLQNAITTIGRGALAGLAAPGGRDTLDNIMGGVRASQDDQTQRAELARKEQDRLAKSEMDMRKLSLDEREARANIGLREAQADEARSRMERSKADPNQSMRDRIAAKERILGRPLTERELQTELKLYQMQADTRPPSRPTTASGMMAARINQQLDYYDKHPEEDPTGERGNALLKQLENLSVGGGASGRPTTISSRTAGVLKSDGTWEVVPESIRKAQQGMQSQSRQWRPRTQAIPVGEDGEYVVIDLDRVGPTGHKRPPKAASASEEIIAQYFKQGGSDKPSSAKPAQSAPPKTATREQVEKFAAKKGISPADAARQLKADGYAIQ